MPKSLSIKLDELPKFKKKHVNDHSVISVFYQLIFMGKISLLWLRLFQWKIFFTYADV